MLGFKLNIDDVTRAFETQNVAFAAGKYRDEVPVIFDLSVSSVQEFENMVVKNRPENPVLLKDIAQVELQENRRSFRMRVGDEPALVMVLSCASDANALEVSNSVKTELKRVQEDLPNDVQVSLLLDQAEFIRESLGNVEKSIIEAILLVIVIIFVFLRNFRASLIPVMTIPISLIGVTTILYAFGYSLNTTTLLALVLAVGLVVDDAIVVLENIYRYIEKGLSPLEASKKGSAEIGFAILAMTVTLASVFAPIAFMTGFTGKLLVEFAVTLSGAVLISGVTALTLSPMMCSKLLKPHQGHLLPSVDVALEKLHTGYSSTLSWLDSKRLLIVGGAILILVFNVVIGFSLPGELTPKEDRGMVSVYTPPIPGKNIDAIDENLKGIEKKLQNVPDVAQRLTFLGGFGGVVVLQLKPIKERSKSASDIANELRGMFASYPIDAYPSSWDNGLPDLSLVETFGEIGVAIKTSGSYESLETQLQEFANDARNSNKFDKAFSSLQLNYPSYKIELDRYVLAQMGLSPALISKTIEAYFSGIRYYDFRKDSVRYDITIEGMEKPWDLSQLYVHDMKGQAVSLATVAKMKPVLVPKELTHYNQMRSAIFNMDLIPGQSIGKAMASFDELKKQHLPKNLRTSWVGAAKVFEDSSNDVFILLIMGLIFIYAIMAIQFESFTDPFIILLTVPLAGLGALLLLWLCGQSLNIFTKVGFLTLVGLITKHGILLVEFANHEMTQGRSAFDAMMTAANLRLRPILMTTLAMVIGSLPLIFTGGAGSESRRAIGLTLVGGLSLGTFLTLTLIPFAYIFIKELKKRSL